MQDGIVPKIYSSHRMIESNKKSTLDLLLLWSFYFSETALDKNQQKQRKRTCPSNYDLKKKKLHQYGVSLFTNVFILGWDFFANCSIPQKMALAREIDIRTLLQFGTEKTKNKNCTIRHWNKHLWRYVSIFSIISIPCLLTYWWLKADFNGCIGRSWFLVAPFFCLHVLIRIPSILALSQWHSRCNGNSPLS